MKLNSERLTLREITKFDLELVHQLHIMPEVDKFNTLGIPDSLETTRQHIEQWIAEQVELTQKKYVFCLQVNQTDFIGLIGLNLGRPAYRNAEVWFKLHPNYWNQGFATEAVRRILDFCFIDLQLHRVEAGCAIENLASKRVLEKVGMQKEGHCRKLLPIRGKWVDNFEFAILDTDYQQFKEI